MKIYIDESGNTGEISCANSKFNFTEQPYYVLAGILLNEIQRNNIEAFILNLKIKFKIQGNELKAKNIYDSKPSFAKEIINYIIENKIPFFIELMDKQFYINMLLVEYFIVPYYSLPINKENILAKRFTASHLNNLLNVNIYDNFIKTIKENTAESLEKFYHILINHFNNTGYKELADNVVMTKEDYFEAKEIDSQLALKKFSPIPDKNPNDRLIHFLPNYGAFTNIIGRTNLYQIEHFLNPCFEIVHDEQKQFDVIFQEALKSMKNVDADILLKNLEKNGAFNLLDSIKLTFTDSKTNIPVQISDLIAGIVMRFWMDFIDGKESKIKTYIPLIAKLNYPIEGSTAGINYVVPEHKHREIMMSLYEYSKQ